MPSQFRRQYRPPVLDVHDAANPPQPVVEFGEGFSELLTGSFAAQQKQAFAAEATVVSKTQKVERLGPATFSPGILSLEPAKTDSPGLFRVQTQSEFRKPFSKHTFEFTSAVTVLHHANEIIRITHQIAFSAYAALGSFDKPQVQYIM